MITAVLADATGNAPPAPATHRGPGSLPTGARAPSTSASPGMFDWDHIESMEQKLSSVTLGAEHYLKTGGCW